ncbi:MAG TPA: beta-ketoacyl synthase N-terminal-like domain-containing protein [Buchnera sp. (in: enterobacteria)]|nr:beta-ketoacyl synthase N-terminal-like domain-containing protein [Buchnera sp. (in: enterobacteria)]
MKRVVITGIGIISCIGNTEKEILNNLKNGRSGVFFSKKMHQLGIRSHICGKVKFKKKYIDRKNLRFMTKIAEYAYVALKNAITNSGLISKIYEKNNKVGIIIGSGLGIMNLRNIFNNVLKLEKFKDPYSIIKYMPSSISSILSVILKLYGVNYAINSACTTSANCIGHAYQLIKHGYQDIVFAGGAEELTEEAAIGFDKMRILSTNYNSIPNKASRVFDTNRDGFVLSEGAGILVLEELNHALSRKAPIIYGELIGYGFSSNGQNMVSSSEISLIRCMNMALNNLKKKSIDYLNPHATSTKKGDIIELNAIKNVFKKNNIPIISATKSMTGHSLGASGVHEIIYTLIMMKNNFIAPSINIDSLDVLAQGMNISKKIIETKINYAMSNSLGFGGTSVSLVLKKNNKYSS